MLFLYKEDFRSLGHMDTVACGRRRGGRTEGKELSDQDREDLDEAAELETISRMPARVKCAELAWRTRANASRSVSLRCVLMAEHALRLHTIPLNSSALKRYTVDYVVMAGYMRKVGVPILNTFLNRVLNLHHGSLAATPDAD